MILLHHALIIWKVGSLSYADLLNVFPFHFIISKITVVNITTNYIRKIFKYWEVYQTLGGGYRFSKNLSFAQKVAFYHWPQIHCFP